MHCYSGDVVGSFTVTSSASPSTSSKFCRGSRSRTIASPRPDPHRVERQASRRPAPQQSGRPALGRRRPCPVTTMSSLPCAARRRTRQATGPTSGGWSAAAPPRSADCTPRRRRRRPRRSSAWPSTRSTAGSPPPAPRPDSKDAGTSHSGRVGLAVELTARGASTHDIQIAGGWKDAGMVARYAASVSTRDGAVRRFMRETKTKP